MRKIYAHGLCAEPCNKDNYSVKATCVFNFLFLGYLQRRQSKMAKETHHMQVTPKMLKFTHA